MCLLMEEMEKQAVRRALVEERGRFCTFIGFLQPVVVRRGIAWLEEKEAKDRGEGSDSHQEFYRSSFLSCFVEWRDCHAGRDHPPPGYH